MIPASQNEIFLVLNSLDALGKNKVLERCQAGFSAIKFTKRNFYQNKANAILNSDFNFIYRSPIFFFSKESWDKIYFSTNF